VTRIAAAPLAWLITCVAAAAALVAYDRKQKDLSDVFISVNTRKMCRIKPSSESCRLPSLTAVIRGICLSSKTIAIVVLIVLAIVATTAHGKKLPKIEALFQGQCDCLVS